LAECAAASEKSPRRRRHRNLHDTNDSIQRILRVLEPQTYMQPHRHLGEAPFRLFVLLRGRVGFVFFNENGMTESATLLHHEVGDYALEVPGDQYFSLVGLEPNSAMLEVREGPIQKDTRQHLAGFPDELEYLTQGPQSDIGRRVESLLTKWKNDVSFHVQKHQSRH
jgi:cupin fold WbuC family metalloprotein